LLCQGHTRVSTTGADHPRVAEVLVSIVAQAWIAVVVLVAVVVAVQALAVAEVSAAPEAQAAP
jgi:hypothetical protein